MGWSDGVPWTHPGFRQRALADKSTAPGAGGSGTVSFTGMAKKTAKKSRRKAVVKMDEPDARAFLDVPPPRPLADMLGHERAVDQLSAAMASGRLHHAWLFHGPEGVGKFTTALAWAALLLDPGTARGLTGRHAADPASPTQRLLAAGTHPDLHVVVKELARFSNDPAVRSAKLTKIPKSVVMDHLIRPAALAPVMRTGSMVGKVFIVDEAELLDTSLTNATSQNAMLKTLEEPSPGTVIILVTSSEDRLLPTIRSRCQRVAFGPLDDQAMRVWLSRSGRQVEAAERDWLLGAAEGSPGRFVSMHDGGMYGWSRAIEPMLADAQRGVHPVALGGVMNGLVDTWAASWVKQGEKNGENRSKDAANRVGVRRMFSLVAEHARASLADPARTPAALRSIEAVGRAQRELDTNVQMRMVLDHLAAGLSSRS